MICYADGGVDINDDDEEVYPDFIVKNGFEHFCSGELFEDVIYQAVQQKGEKNLTPTMSELVAALDYYIKHDTYLTLN
jgi:hypothetical protein